MTSISPPPLIRQVTVLFLRFQDSGASRSYSGEGCFCPPGSTLFNRVYDTCVTSCCENFRLTPDLLIRPHHVPNRSFLCVFQTVLDRMEDPKR